MKNFVKIAYTGRIKDGNVFDTTSEEIAKKEGIFNEKRIYKSMPVIVGEKQVIEGLDDALGKMKAGEKKTVEITPEKGYGKRDPKLVRLVPMKLFKQQKMNPIPGMSFELDGRPARIQTVAGGRVTVDFNSELAGKTLVFDVELQEKAKDNKQKIEYLVERSFNTSEGFKSKTSETKLEIALPESSYRDRDVLFRKASLVAEVFKYLDFKEVTFKEVWSKKEKSK